MKKTVFSLAILGFMFCAAYSFAQNDPADVIEPEVIEADNSQAEVMEAEQEPMVDEADSEEPVVPKRSGTQVIKKFFIDGGSFMFPVLICLILGLAIAIEKIITLNLKTINSRKLLTRIEELFKKKDIDGAQELCRNTKGSVASVFYQAIARRGEGLEGVEKSIVSYGSVQMAMLEKGLVWIALFISLAPMLGFMGTVVGMIDAFDKIEQAGTISPSLVAGGIKIALLTTVGGLIVAVILQIFYNYLVSKVDTIVNDMEDSSITLVDMMMEYDVAAKS